MNPFFLSKRVGFALAAVASLLACSNGASNDDAGSDASTCTTPGEATPGPADTHCQGTPPQPVSPASCTPDAGADDAGTSADGGAPDTCAYGDTMFGNAGDDDDCKYHVTWTSDPICEGSVQFTVKVTSLVDGTPVTGIPGGVLVEQFIPTAADAACDDKTTHPGPNIGSYLVETPAGSGTYVGPVAFDAPGDWTLRFHIHEECQDLLDDSPHGHAAFHITVP